MALPRDDELGPGPARHLSTFNISEELFYKLRSHGYLVKRDVDSETLDQLAATCSLTEEEKKSVYENVKTAHSKVLRMTDGQKLLYQEEEKIVTLCQSLDEALDGGVHVSRLTEIAGEGGSGKSQICMQLCINVQLPKELGGLAGDAIYIDTEGRFKYERVEAMATSAVKFCKGSLQGSSFDLSVKHFTSHIQHRDCRTLNSGSLMRLIELQLPQIVEKNPNVRLIIIDSIAQHFRYRLPTPAKEEVDDEHLVNEINEKDYREKAFELANIKRVLKKLAYEKKIAVVLTNHVIYSFDNQENIPALGKAWQHVCSSRIMIKRAYDEGVNLRTAKVMKSQVVCDEKQYKFVITGDGIRDVEAVLHKT